jgi:N4-gp56 family major capsid protein
MADVTSTSVSADQRKMVAAKLLIRSQLKLVAQSICEKQKQEKGMGTQFTLIRYARMNVPIVTLTEGVTPGYSSLTVETVTGSLDQWGDVVRITDVAKLTTLHPLTEIAVELLGDNAQRVMDREVQIVMMAGTNVQYGDGSVTSRAAVTNAMTASDNTLLRAKIVMGTNGAPLRSGPSNMKSNASAGPLAGTIAGGAHYVAVGGLEIMADIMRMAAANGLWQNVNQYNNGGKGIYMAEVGTYLGYRFVETNFIPRFKRLGNVTVNQTFTDGLVVADCFGITGLTATHLNTGTMTSGAAYGIKITRKSLQRGFEEDISIIHTATMPAVGNNEALKLDFPATAGYVYQVYFDSVAGGGSTTDANLKLVSQNIAAGGSLTITAAQATGIAPPPSTNTVGPVDSIYPLYLLGDQCLVWTGLQDLQTPMTGNTPDKADPLGQLSTVGYKFTAKAAIMNQQFLMRVELPSAFNI